MKQIHPADVIDNSPVRSFHIWLMIWLFLVITLDGYDVVIYGASVPLLIQEWGISDVTAGAIGSYTVIGTAIGAVLFGMLADRMGRKKIILLTTFLFGFFTFLAGFAPNPILFTISRVIAGIGLGGVMPNVIALATEMFPKRVRTAIVASIFCGYSVGAIAAALTSRALLPTVGWESIYWIGGVPVLFLPFLMKGVPESVGFLLEKGREEEARKVLALIDPHISHDGAVELVKPERKTQVSLPIVKLFTENRAFSTVMFWLSCFSAFVLIYSMNTWLPRLMMKAGYDLSSSLAFTAVMQIGAIIGTVVFGPLVNKWGFKRVLVPLFFCGAVALSLIGFMSSTIVAFALIAIIGAASVGVQNIANAFVSQYYPEAMRSTALGSTMAFGRIGGIVAPTFVGVLLSFNLPPQYNFAAIASAAVLGGLAVLLVQEKYAIYRNEQAKTGNGQVTVS
ncbi:MFS transporter [Geobacillus thermoleovorans]|uniref:MFS transporter n=1 Tax=Geobacillus thermoleovorans TaxID=33941 RepID=UPI000845E2C4|nr:aromatic acid/H+ symport family MFS transporter [Geobacillus thermoleovorans]AOL34316.1 MFS transporter [Geobacillus thermoleovorans]